MLPDRVSNPGPLTYESGALPIALRGPATVLVEAKYDKSEIWWTSLYSVLYDQKKDCDNVSVNFLCL